MDVQNFINTHKIIFEDHYIFVRSSVNFGQKFSIVIFNRTIHFICITELFPVRKKNNM